MTKAKTPEVDAVTVFAVLVATYNPKPDKMTPATMVRGARKGLILYDQDGHELLSMVDAVVDWEGVKAVYINALGEIEGIADDSYQTSDPHQLVLTALMAEAVERGMDHGDPDLTLGYLAGMFYHCISVMGSEKFNSLVHYTRTYIFDFDSDFELATHKIHFKGNCGNIVVSCADRSTVLAWLLHHDLLKYVDYIEKPRQPVFGDHPFATLVAEASRSEYCEKCPVAGIMMGCTTERIRELKESLSHNV